MSELHRLGDRYEIGEVVGRGGMAEVHEGRDLRLGRRVAVKILRPDLARDPSFQARFRREAQSAASLNHPNIVAVYDTGEDILTDGPEGTGLRPYKDTPSSERTESAGYSAQVVPYIVMEYVDGMTLRQLMSSGRRLLPERAMEIADGVLAALDYSHRHGIVHRDIKPGNVMLTRAGEVKVMDFGIARAMADSGQTMTSASMVMGTAQYLSPEQARGELVDARSDLYSTGALLYELLTGRPPFTGDSPVAVAYQHVSEPPVPPSELDPSIPASIDAIVLRALAKRPEDRYQSAADMRSDVERAIAGLPVTAAMAAVAVAPDSTVAMPRTTAQVETAPKRRPWLWVLSILGIVAVAVAAVLIGKAVFGTPAVESVAAPDLTGRTIEQAQADLAAVGLVLGTQTPQASDDKPAGTVINQNPPATTAVQRGSAVDITFSTGKDQQAVPDLVDFNKDDARTALTAVGLTLGKVKPANSDKPVDSVIAQDPEPGVMVDPGTAVNITVSNGKVPVPDVRDKSQAQASADLVNAGFQVNPIFQTTEDESAWGKVMAQSPDGGEFAVKGTQVTITIGKKPSESPTPPPPSSEPPASPAPDTSP